MWNTVVRNHRLLVPDMDISLLWRILWSLYQVKNDDYKRMPDVSHQGKTLVKL